MTAEFHSVNINDFGVTIENAADGVQYVTSAEPLGDYPVKLTDKLVHWANETPDTVLISQRGESGEWESLTFAQTLERVRSIASWMLTQNLSNDRPVVILSGNSTEHLLVALASMYIGVPFSPISTAYSLISSDYGKLRHVFDTLTPGLIFTDNLGPYRDAIDAVNTGKAPVLTCSADHATDGLSYAVSNLADAISYRVSAEAD
ncbi:MAG: AMP-binding protein, partial [Marinobacterium sp.]